MEVGCGNIQEDGSYPDGRGVAVGDLNNDGFPRQSNLNPSQSSPLAQQPGIPNVLLSAGNPDWLIDLLVPKVTVMELVLMYV